MKLGNVELHLVSDGAIHLDGGTLFGIVPKTLWRAKAPPDRKNRVTIGLNCLLIRSGGKNILVDTGVGTKHPRQRRAIYAMAAGALTEALRQRGLAPDEIDLVVMTHLHFDHAGGCTRLDAQGHPIPTFPRATYLIQRRDWEEATHTNERTRAAYLPEDFLPLEERGQLALLDGDQEITPGVWVQATGGHTSGHQMVLIDSGEQRAACGGDILPTPHHLPPHYTTAWDLFPLDTVRRKRELLAQAEREGWLLLFGHGLETCAGYLTREGERLILKPASL
ncbi:MAG: MBL fold metallo-hydrolase [Dehalococcoidia bacterium]